MTVREFEHKVITSVTLEKEEEDAIEKIGWREHKSKTKMYRRAIQEYIRAHQEGNDTHTLDNWNDDPNFKAVPTILSRPEIWYKYLEQCSPKERTEIQIRAVSIKNQCLNLNQKEF